MLRQGADASDVAVLAAAAELGRIVDAPESQDGVKILKALIEFEALEIRLACMPSSGTIFHDKIGIFGDAFGNALSFSGSANETWRAWHPKGNHESFEIFCSWRAADAARVADHAAFFEQAWRNERPGIEVVDLKAAFSADLVAVGPDDPEQVLRDAAEVSGARAGSVSNPIKLGKHQRRAVDAWEANGCRGVLKHATGSGKTFTALEAIRRHIERGGPSVVLVPSVLLLDQWSREADRFFAPDPPSTLLVGAGNTDWRREGAIGAFTAPNLTGPRLTIATLQTAVSEDFRQMIQGGDHLLVVCDEVHNFGAPSYRSLDALDAGARLGLSATPERFRDPEGTAAIFDYFGPVLEPVLTLEDAVEAGRLCPYDYFVHPVDLEPDEVDEWDEVTNQIKRVAAIEGGLTRGEMSERMQLLLIRRSRIAKQAARKAPMAASIVEHNFRAGQHWLVYCDDRDQLRTVVDLLKERGLPTTEYWSEMKGDRAATMAQFERSGGVLVAIKCLDEGVDVPKISHGIILASTQNPREFIQRRGRMLRRSDDKHYAVIHDLLVAPPENQDSNFDSLVAAELVRAREFAESATNEACKLDIESLRVAWGAPDETSSLTLEVAS
jgi:superfamily II DNA or RNA helicase